MSVMNTKQNYDRFDFEQQLLDCWNVTKDLELYLNQHEGMTEDQKLNFLIGVKAIYDAKFEQVWQTFESLLQQRQFF